MSKICRKYIFLAGIVMELEDKLEVISLATGVKDNTI